MPPFAFSVVRPDDGDVDREVAALGLITTKANFVIAQGNATATTVGLLEITGSQATIDLAKLENQNGVNHTETISWIADANGVTSSVTIAEICGRTVQS